MDPKKFANIDPKLREAYERVMNSNVSASVAAPAPTPAVAPAPAPIVQQVNTVSIPPSAPATVNTPKPPTAAGLAAPHQENSGILKIVLIVGGIIFFLVYALFWVKFFGIQLPFLSSFF